MKGESRSVGLAGLVYIMHFSPSLSFGFTIQFNESSDDLS